MSNFKRYTMVIRRDQTGFAYPALKVRQKGDVLKFDEVKEFLKPAANIDYTAALEKELSNINEAGSLELTESDVHEIATRLNYAIKDLHNCA